MPQGFSRRGKLSCAGGGLSSTGRVCPLPLKKKTQQNKNPLSIFFLLLEEREWEVLGFVEVGGGRPSVPVAPVGGDDFHPCRVTGLAPPGAPTFPLHGWDPHPCGCAEPFLSVHLNRRYKTGNFIFYSCVYMVAFPKMLQDPQKKAPAGLRGPPTGRNDAEPPGLCRGEELLGALGP